MFHGGAGCKIQCEKGCSDNRVAEENSSSRIVCTKVSKPALDGTQVVPKVGVGVVLCGRVAVPSM